MSERLGRSLLRLILLLGHFNACASEALAGENAGEQASSFRTSQQQSESIKPRRLPGTYAGDEEPDKLTTGESRQILILEIFTYGWILCFGGTVGSFLNVVAYRLPLGISLIHPPSRCSRCETNIEFRDNLPLIGWMLLRGKCRQCHCPISVRYPLVETLTGVMFLVVAHIELLSGGATLPVRNPNTYTGVVWILWYTKWDLVGIYLYHMMLVSVLITLALMAQDNSLIPHKFWFPTGLSGTILPVLFPNLHPLPWSMRLWSHYCGTYSEIPVWWAPASVIIGGTVGWIAGMFPGKILSHFSSQVDTGIKYGSRISFLLIGIFLGWQAVLGIGVLSLILSVLSSLLTTSKSTTRFIASWIPFAASSIFLLTWRIWPVLEI